MNLSSFPSLHRFGVFFFQAEDGIREGHVTGVQTCALPIFGAPDFTTFVEQDLTQQTNSAQANTMLNPVAVSSDGVRLLVTDLGHNRVLVWNSIPTANAAPADLVLGQPDMTSATPNNGYKVDPADTTKKQTPVLCTESNGT